MLQLDICLLCGLPHEQVNLVLWRRNSSSRGHGVLHVRRLHIQVGELGFKLVHDKRYLRGCELGRADEKDKLTRSRFMLSIALSMPLTTDVMLPVTCRIVTAVSTRLATASMRLDSLRRFSASLFLRIALEAYIRAPSVLPCCRAYFMDWIHKLDRFGRRTFLSLDFSEFSSFWAFLACRFSDLAVNYVALVNGWMDCTISSTLSWNRVSGEKVRKFGGSPWLNRRTFKVAHRGYKLSHNYRPERRYLHLPNRTPPYADGHDDTFGREPPIKVLKWVLSST